MSTIKAMSLYNDLSARARVEISSRLKVKAKHEWNVECSKMIDTGLADELRLLLQTRKKNAQQKLLAGMVFNSDILISVIINAWRLFKMPYSRITVEFAPKEFTIKRYPRMMYMKDDGEFDVIGPTELSKAEMRIAIEKRHWVISDFIGDEEHWHCFFRTMSGIKGNEIPHVGKPHLHYISSALG